MMARYFTFLMRKIFPQTSIGFLEMNANPSLEQTCFATPNIVSLEIVGEKLFKLAFFFFLQAPV